MGKYISIVWISKLQGILSILLLLYFAHCKPAPYCNAGDQSNKCGILQALGTPSPTTNAPNALVFAGNPFTFALHAPIAAIAPTVTGTVTNCTANPPLPAGLSIDNTTCRLGGTPTTAQKETMYTITASNNNGQTTATITISVGAAVIYSWGTFIDKMNGTVLFKGDGTFTGPDGENYAGQTLLFMKCSQGQVWNEAANDCSGTGTSPLYGAGAYQFCSVGSMTPSIAGTTDCSGGVLSNSLGVGGFLNGQTSQAWTTCDGLNTSGFAGKSTWRVPTKAELKTLVECTDKIMPADFSACVGSSPSISNLFPNTDGTLNPYWSSTSYDTGNPTYGIFALYVDFSGASLESVSNYYLTTPYYVRCVAGQ